MANDKKTMEIAWGESGFLKTPDKPALPGEQKAALNRKGNALYNAGDIEGARRVFLTTGYSDGLARIGDYYKSQGRELDALKMYWIAPDHRKAEPVIEKLSAVIQNLLRDEQGDSHE